MIVSGREEPIIADYAIKSFSKLTKLNFKLIVYSNYIDEISKNKYFQNWKSIEYVELIENNHQEIKEFSFNDSVEFQQGKFDLPGKIWDEQLPKIKTDVLGIVDADFEILSPDIVYKSIEIIKSDQNILGISHGFSPSHLTNSKLLPEDIASKYVFMQSHWSNYFIIYNKNNIDFNFSFAHRWEKKPNDIVFFWDTHSFIQNSLIPMGYKMLCIEEKYYFDGIHYWGFSRNTKINEKNVKIYRLLRIFAYRGIKGIKYSNLFFKVLEKIFLGAFLRDRYKFNIRSNGNK